MEANTTTLVLQIAVAAALVGTIYVNYLAQKLPINGLTQTDISESLPNLFTPAGLTFSIWGVIYLLLAAYTVFQLGLFKKNRSMSEVSITPACSRSQPVNPSG